MQSSQHRARFFWWTVSPWSLTAWQACSGTPPVYSAGKLMMAAPPAASVQSAAPPWSWWTRSFLTAVDSICCASSASIAQPCASLSSVPRRIANPFYRAFRAGASAYLSKYDALHNFAQILNAVTQGETYLSPRLLKFSQVTPSGLANLRPKVDALSDREYLIFRLIARQPGCLRPGQGTERQRQDH